MAGRGRGRGANLSLTHEQLQALGLAGIGRGENTAQILTPPPLFPKIDAKPLPLAGNAATDYMLIVKDQFIEYLHDSPAFVKAKTRTDGIERYSDKYKVLAEDAKKGKVLDCVWSNMPGELKPQARRARVVRKRKLEDPADIAKKLQTLEKKESQETDENMETNEDEEALKKADNEEEVEDEQEQEYEIDDGTDYANNYFDNGDDYDEEDDNDDGPVY